FPGDNITEVTRPTLGGTADPGSSVRVTDGARVLGTVTADATGSWSFTVGTALANGSHNLGARATDLAGNNGATGTLTVVIDPMAVNAPSRPALAPGNDTGTAGDNLTDIPAPSLVGTSEPGTIVELFDGAASLGTTTASASGAWALAVGPLADGV